MGDSELVQERRLESGSPPSSPSPSAPSAPSVNYCHGRIIIVHLILVRVTVVVIPGQVREELSARLRIGWRGEARVERQGWRGEARV